MTSDAHCASASDGASTTGTPSSLSSLLHSSLWILVTFTVRFASFATASSSAPASLASARSAAASPRAPARRESSSRLASGGAPSKT